jgi:Family of unknown function (DUF5327)
MEISSKQLVSKMEELVGKAKHTNSEEKFKGYILAIQALCEVMVNEETSTPTPIASLKVSHAVKQIPTVQSGPTISISEPVKMDDANGSSLFDF